jgi:hypothetical protein
MNQLAATTAHERAEALIRLTGRLSELLDQETALFEARKPHQAVALQTEKTRLATIYRTETRLAGQDASRLAGLAPPVKTRLRESSARFEASLVRNGAAVEALKVLTEGLVKALADEATRQAQSKAGYGPNASRASIGAIACNQTA